MPILLVIQKTIVIYHKVSLYILFSTCNSMLDQISTLQEVIMQCMLPGQIFCFVYEYVGSQRF